MKILIHACCGPCSLMPIKILRAAGHEVTACFVNPNIHPLSEYFRRREAMAEAAKALDVPVIWRDDVYNLSMWLAHVYTRNIAANPNGQRCAFCYASRLVITAQEAETRGFDAFTSSLLYSRHQRHDSIKEQGQLAAAQHAVPFLAHDFRPHWQEGIDASKELGLFRQNYCACIFSEEERFTNKIEKLKKSIE